MGAPLNTLPPKPGYLGTHAPTQEQLTTFAPIRKQVLDIAMNIICKDRQDQHGSPEDTFAIIAEMWEAFLWGRTGHRVVVHPQDVAQMMVLFKVARYTQNPKNLDNYLDAVGYEALAAELAKVEPR